MILSVIIPARNEKRWIPDTLDAALSAAEQLRRSQGAESAVAEVLVVDNDSDDGTDVVARGYVEAHGEGVRLLRLTERGAARARNLGGRQARGRILVFVDADTRIPSDGLVRIVERCERDGYEGGISRLASLDGGLRARVWWTFWEHVRRLPLPKAKAMPALMFCTREVFDEFGPFDEAVAIGEEWPILARLYQFRPRRFVYDRSLTALSSSRRMERQPFGYSRTFFKYLWAILHQSGRVRYTDRFR